MEDSIELPASDEENQQINFFVSPNNSLKKPKLQMTHTASQQSLAYSNQTHAKYHATERSPIEIRIPNFQTNEKPRELQRMIKARKQRGQKTQRSSPPLIQTQGSQQLVAKNFMQQQSNVPNIRIHRQERKKTINQRDENNLRKKYKQLQYALQVEVISSQQLRTKVSILTELLEGKIKQSQFSYLLKFKNTSKNLSNTDIFIELKQTNKKLKECELIIERQRQQIQSLKHRNSNNHSKSLTILQQQKQNINNSNFQNQNQASYTNSAYLLQMQALVQEKQSLFNYIEQFRKQYNSKNLYCQQVKQQLQRCQEKQHKFITLQRPKFIQQISDLSSKVKNLQQQLQKVRMQANLVELNYENQLQQARYNIKQKQRKMQGITIGVMTEVFNKSVTIQTDFRNEQQQLLKAQLKLLKTQRDYYIDQFKKKVNESSQNYLLKLKIKAYENIQRPNSNTLY